MTHRHLARSSFRSLVIGGALVFGTSVAAVVRSGAVVTDSIERHTRQLASACGCISASSLNTGVIIGSVALLTVSAFVLGATVVKAWLVYRTTARFTRSFSVVPMSEKLRTASRTLGIEHRVAEVAATNAAAFCSGLVRPKIFVSETAVVLLDDDELRAVLEHERYHLEQHDPLRIFLADVATWLVRRLPGLRSTQREFRSSIELAADEAVLRRGDAASILGNALLKLLPAKTDPPAAHPAVTFFGTTDRRIDQILGGPAPRSGKGIRALLAAGFIVAAAVALVTLSLGKLQVEAKEAAPGQCQEIRHACRAPQPSLQGWMSTPVQLLSSPASEF